MRRSTTIVAVALLTIIVALLVGVNYIYRSKLNQTLTPAIPMLTFDRIVAVLTLILTVGDVYFLYRLWRSEEAFLKQEQTRFLLNKNENMEKEFVRKSLVGG